MRKITISGIDNLSSEESDRIRKLVCKDSKKDFHYLAFDRQLSGFSPLGTYVGNFPDLRVKESEIIAELIERQEVKPLFPDAKLSLYPVTKIDGPQYYLDMDNCEKHFADVLQLNDTVYKTKYIYVYFGHGAENFDESLLIQNLSELLSQSNMLEAIYIEDTN